MEIENEGCSAIYFYVVPLIYVATYIAFGDAIGGATGWGICIVLAVLSLATYVFFILEARKVRSFLLFLANNRESLVQGNTIEYESAQLDMKSEIRSYESCITFLLPWPGGIRINSGYLIEGYHKTLKLRVIYTLGSLLFGWWGVWTIVWIFLALFRNLAGGHKLTIAQLVPADSDS